LHQDRHIHAITGNHPVPFHARNPVRAAVRDRPCRKLHPRSSPQQLHGKPWILPGIPNATVRLHWTDQPYKWHINDGEEVFVVLDGAVDMHTRAVL